MSNHYMNPITGSYAFENDNNGMHHDSIVYCPIMSYGNCPYCDQCNICHIDDPLYDCDDFSLYYNDWDMYELLNR